MERMSNVFQSVASKIEVEPIVCFFSVPLATQLPIEGSVR